MKKMKKTKLISLGIILALSLGGCKAKNVQSQFDADSIDDVLRKTLVANQVEPLPKPQSLPAKVRLGKMLFFDKILSGNKNISCATCHLPEAATSDALPLSIGEGGTGRMTKRVPPKEKEEAVFVRRNSLDVFNRGYFDTMFWDGRVSSTTIEKYLTPNGRELLKRGKIVTPAGFVLPDGLDNALAAQAMFPPTSDVEMRGNFHENQFGDLDYFEYEKIWSGLMERLLAIDEYRQLLKDAYPDVPVEEYSFVHIANAIAAFEIDSFTFLDSPFDRYLQGDENAMHMMEKRGALLFYTTAGCAECHSGSLMSDQLYHNRVVPQIGPGKGKLPGGGKAGTWDAGRGGVTGMRPDYYCFRTPPLRNVSKTGPWMHDGTFATLEATVRHELDPKGSAANYDPYAHLPAVYAKTYHQDQMETIARLAKPADTKAVSLNDQQVEELIAFLDSLTSPQLENLVRLTPDKVPSGLPVED